MNTNEILSKINDSQSYFLTLTVKDNDNDKTENNLTHYVIRKEFDTDDIVPSFDASVRSLRINLEKSVDVVVPPVVSEEKKRPLKIAIISHFNSMPQSYSPARAVKNQIKLLREHDHEVVFFLQEGSPLTEEDLGCKVLKVIPKFKREKNIVNVEIKNKLIDIFREYLTSDFDIAITHDFFIQDTITFSEAIRECGVPIEWLHFARSGVAHDMTFAMPNARFCYLNKTDIGRFAKAIKVPVEQCRAIYNEKDPGFMFHWNPVTKMIVNKYKLWEKDIIQTIGLCSTRFGAKGVNSMIAVFSELKKLGNKVSLILCNSNGKKRIDDLKETINLAREYGLEESDFIITSLLADDEYKIESEVSNQTVAELMSVSNLFIFASVAEVGPNVWLEAAMTKQLLVANSDLPLLYDFVDKDKCLSYPFTSKQSLHYSGRDNKSLNDLAKQIVGQIKSNKADLAFRQVWRNHNGEVIYKMLESVLYEKL